MTSRRFVLSLALGAILALNWGSAAKADLSVTLPEFNGASHTPTDPYPLPPVTVGVFNFMLPAGEVITGAQIHGTFGNSTVDSSAGVDVELEGLLVGQNVQFGPGYFATTPWSYTFTPADLSLLASGSATLTATQTSEFNIRLGVTTLDIQTAVVPEPGSIMLLGGGAFGLFRKLRRPRRTA